MVQLLLFIHRRILEKAIKQHDTKNSYPLWKSSEVLSTINNIERESIDSEKNSLQLDEITQVTPTDKLSTLIKLYGLSVKRDTPGTKKIALSRGSAISRERGEQTTSTLHYCVVEMPAFY